MQTYKPLYFNTYKFSFNLLLLILTTLLMNGCVSSSQPQNSIEKTSKPVSENAVNLNTADADELEKLPHIGEEMAKRIIEHRAKFGKFQRAENLILVRGMSDKKFRDLQNLVKAE